MISIPKVIVASIAALSLAAIDGVALAQPKEKKDKDRTEQGAQGNKGGKDNKEKKLKKVKHVKAKDLVGDKIKKNGKHKFHESGKHSAFVNVKDGKITGVNVAHAEKGDVPVKKYKTKKDMSQAQAGSIHRVSFSLAQSGTTYVGTTWIGYAYYDDWGDEVIYWFPYDMIYDYDTGATEYVPSDYY